MNVWNLVDELKRIYGFVTTTKDPISGARSFDSDGDLLEIAGVGYSHVKVALLGDSITVRATLGSGTPPANSVTAISPWNQANWLLGAPFVFAQNLGVSGDLTKGIMSRVSAIQRSIQCVFIMAGTNDVNSMSSSAVQATIDSTYTTVSGQIGAGLAALAAAGKTVVLTTIPPNNNLSGGTDSRIQLIDRLNAFITAQASSTVFVADVFTAMWDSTQPTLRVAKTNYLNSDGLHPTNLGAYYAGKAMMQACAAAYHACTPNIDIYQDFQLVRPLYSEFRRSTGGSAGTISAGSGTIADGWRCLQNAGTATFTVDATQAYSAGDSFVGPWAEQAVSPDAYWQVFNITAAAASDNPRLRLPANTDLNQGGNLQDGCFGGSEFFAEFEIIVTSPVNLQEVSIGMDATFSVGTSPADQAWAGTTYNRYKAGTATDSSSSGKAMDEGYRMVLRTGVLRVPENISTAAVYLVPYVDMIFNGTGSAAVAIGKPRIWHKAAGRLS